MQVGSVRLCVFFPSGLANFLHAGDVGGPFLPYQGGIFVSAYMQRSVGVE